MQVLVKGVRNVGRGSEEDSVAIGIRDADEKGADNGMPIMTSQGQEETKIRKTLQDGIVIFI